MEIEVYTFIASLISAFSVGFAVAKLIQKTITEKNISCHIIEALPKKEKRFKENSKINLLYENANPKTLICKYKSKNLIFQKPNCSLNNKRCTFF